MRDPNRIDRVLEAIREAWAKDPDSRLGQLLYNVVRSHSPSLDLFSIEDSVLEKLVTQMSEGQIMTRHVFNVVDTSVVSGRGLLVTADKRSDELPSWLSLNYGNEIEFRSNGNILHRAKVDSIDFETESMILSVMLQTNATKDQVPPGCEVWRH